MLSGTASRDYKKGNRDMDNDGVPALSSDRVDKALSGHRSSLFLNPVNTADPLPTNESENKYIPSSSENVVNRNISKIATASKQLSQNKNIGSKRIKSPINEKGNK